MPEGSGRVIPGPNAAGILLRAHAGVAAVPGAPVVVIAGLAPDADGVFLRASAGAASVHEGLLLLYASAYFTYAFAYPSLRVFCASAGSPLGPP